MELIGEVYLLHRCFLQKRSFLLIPLSLRLIFWRGPGDCDGHTRRDLPQHQKGFFIFLLPIILRISSSSMKRELYRWLPTCEHMRDTALQVNCIFWKAFFFYWEFLQIFSASHFPFFLILKGFQNIWKLGLKKNRFLCSWVDQSWKYTLHLLQYLFWRTHPPNWCLCMNWKCSMLFGWLRRQQGAWISWQTVQRRSLQLHYSSLPWQLQVFWSSTSSFGNLIIQLGLLLRTHCQSAFLSLARRYHNQELLLPPSHNLI